MATKTPEEFKVGDVIAGRTPYSGSQIKATEEVGDGMTEAIFDNGEVVQFYNGIHHEMQE